MRTTKQTIKRVGIAIAGGFVLVIGILAIPYPGPGWLIVFTGLAILATEFQWARRLLDRARGEYDRWQMWLKRQHVIVRLLVLGCTGFVVVMSMWLLNVFGMIDNILDLHMPRLHSPLGFFS